MDRSDLRESEYRALAELRYRLRRFITFSEGAARALGVESQQHQLLLAIRGLPDLARPTIGVMAERLQIEHNSAVELVRRAVGRGLVQREPSKADRREVLLSLTSDGERVLRELSVAHRAELRTAGPALVRALATLVPARRRT